MKAFFPLFLLALARSAPLPAASFQGSESVEPSLGVDALRTEHELEPLDLESSVPRFSWKLVARDPAARGLAQSGYRILVSSTPEALEAETGELWDSGRVASRESVDVAYAGRPLGAFEHAYWCVRVFDRAGTPSPWSPPAHFGMGALAPSDWSASWIGFDAPLAAPRLEPDLEGSQWVRAPDGGPELWLRRRFSVAALENLRAAVLVGGADELEIFVNGRSVLRSAARPGQTRGAELVRLTPAQLVVGENLLAARVRRKDGPAALIAKLVLHAAEDSVTVSDARWRANSSAAPGFENAGFDDGAWSDALPLEEGEEEALGPLDTPTVRLPPPRLLRGKCIVNGPLRHATLYASALGTTAIELNGVAVGDDWFGPGWNDYAKRIPYRAYDVTASMLLGENVLGVVLADGWYAGFLGKRGKRDNYGAATRFFGQLELEYLDGTRERFVSDGTWRARLGPWQEADLYMGERYDARAEILGWSTISTESRAWVPVDLDEEPEQNFAVPLTRHGGAPIRVVAELPPVAVTAPVPGRLVFDLGQNIAGVANLEMEVPAGTTLVLRHGERLSLDGTVYRGNLTWARAVDRYQARGGGIERWHPRFTYHGFRYVEVQGLPDGAQLSLTGLALSSATSDVGDFACSDAGVNRLVANARWTLRANSMDVPTDCPQRGERLGWTGDAQLFAPSALWLADLEGLYTKWARDVLDAQRADGEFPAIAPGWETVGPGGPAWADAGVLVPARLFEVYGDRRMLVRHLDSMRRFVDRRLAELGAELRVPADLASFGDWGAIGATTPVDVVAFAYLARDLRVLAHLERSLGNGEEAARRESERARVQAAFVRDCLDHEGRLRAPTQTALALALREELLPDAARTWAAETLRGALEEHGIATGFVGTPELLPALSAIDATRDAYALLAARSYPSWGYMLEQGATTLWERWDAFTAEHGIARGGHVSFSHTPLGSYVAWLFEDCAGMRPDEPGFRSVQLAPQPGGTLTWAQASYDSVRGRIALRWELVEKDLVVTVEVPPGVEATLALRTRDPVHVLEGDKPFAEAASVRELSRVGDSLLLTLESGRYRFRVPEPILAR